MFLKICSELATGSRSTKNMFNGFLVYKLFTVSLSGCMKVTLFRGISGFGITIISDILQLSSVACVFCLVSSNSGVYLIFRNGISFQIFFRNCEFDDIILGFRELLFKKSGMTGSDMLSFGVKTVARYSGYRVG